MEELTLNVRSLRIIQKRNYYYTFYLSPQQGGYQLESSGTLIPRDSTYPHETRPVDKARRCAYPLSRQNRVFDRSRLPSRSSFSRIRTRRM